MNKYILHLSRIAGKESRNIIGLMSGTSLDGLDIALCNISGSGRNMKLQLVHFATLPYDVFFKEEVKTIFSRELVDLRKLTLLNEWIGKTHASMINQQLEAWAVPKTDIDLIASHGQTIYHAPLSLHQNQIF
ncbi:MAG: anhydro-N-acetylmuramic acid kinase, partial [Chitinophagaceae bacterium]